MRSKAKGKRISKQLSRKVKDDLYANNPFYKALIDKRNKKPAKVKVIKQTPKQAPKQANKQKVSDLSYLFNKPYSEFLKSGYWLRVRKIVLIRDKKACTCGETKKLQVHHLTYKNHFKEMENLNGLITLCSDCHKKVHDIE